MLTARRHIASFLTLCAALLAIPCPAQDSAPKRLVIPRFDTARVTLDGVLAEPEWDKAALADGFVTVPGGQPAAPQTQCRVFVSGQTLYFGFTCFDPSAPRLVAQARKHDDPKTYMDDCVEIMVSPDNDPAVYYHLIATAAGGQYDAKAGDAQWSPSPAWQLKTAVLHDRWTAEIAVPAMSFGKENEPRRGHIWALKLLREYKAQGVERNEINSSWTPIASGGFTSPAGYGQAVFEDTNMLTNAGMEEDADRDNVPDAWDRVWRLAKDNPQHRRNADEIEPFIDAQDKVEGHSSARFTRKAPGGFMGVLQQSAYVRKGCGYEFSVMVKVEGLADRTGGAYLTTQIGEQKQSVKIPPDAKGWNRYTLSLTADSDGWLNVGVNHWKSPCVVWVDDARLVLTGRGIAPGERCLTLNHNGPGAEKVNLDTGGDYIVCEYATDQPCFPTGQTRGRAPVPIAQGSIAGGKPEPMLWGGKEPSIFDYRAKGRDVVFDLKRDFLITRVQIVPCMANLEGASVSVQPSSSRKLRLAAAKSVAPGAMTGFIEFEGLDAPARRLRVNVRHANYGQIGLQAIRIYGKEAPTKSIAAAEPRLDGWFESPGEQSPNLELLAGAPPQVPVYPLPAQSSLGLDAMPLSGASAVLLPAGPDSRTALTAKTFVEDAAVMTGLALRAAPTDRLQGRPVLVLAPDGSASETSLQRAAALAADAGKLKDEGYALEVTTRGAVVAGKDDAGLFYGLQTLLQLLTRAEDGRWALRAASIRDYPQFPFRSIRHNARTISGDWQRTRIAAHAHLKYNYASGLLAFDAEPNDGDETLRYADARFYKITPLLAMTPNPCFYTRGSPLTQEERDKVYECLPGESFQDIVKNTIHQRMNFCPSNPRSWEGLSHVWKSVATRYNSPYIQLGTDEMYQTHSGSRWNVCPLCKARNMTNGELLLDAMLKADKIVRDLGKRPAWFSTLHSHPNQNPSEKDSYAWPFERLPKDTMMLDYYRRGSDKLSASGYAVVVGATGVQELTPASGVAGAETWNWGSDEEEGLASGGQLLTYVIQAEQNWTAFSARAAMFSPEFYRRTAMGLRAFRRQLKGYARPSELPGRKEYFPVDLTSWFNESLAGASPSEGNGWLGLGPQRDLSALAGARLNVRGIPFDVPASPRNCVVLENRGFDGRTLPHGVRGVPVGRTLDSIVFLHTVSDESDSNYARTTSLAGIYLIRYRDGSCARADIRLGVTARAWTAGFGADPAAATLKAILYEAECAWAGKTRSGKVVSVWAAEWTNPHPEKEIASFDCIAPWKKTHANPVLLAATGVTAQGFRPTARLLAQEPLRPYVAPTHGEDLPGRPIDLATGVVVKSDRECAAPDGTLITASHTGRIDKRETADLVNLLFDDNTRWSSPGPATLTVAFPAPRRLLAVRLTGILELDRYPGPQRVTGAVEVSTDGDQWKAAGSFEEYCGDEGPRAFLLGGGQVAAVRVRFTRGQAGLSYLELRE